MCDFVNFYKRFCAVIITKIRLANSAAIRLPECVLAPEIRLSPDSAGSHQEADLACFLDYRTMHSGAERIFSAVGSGKDDVPQSGKSKKLAPAIRADVAGHDLARARRTKQGAGGAGEATLRPVLILGFGLRPLLLRRRP